MVTQTTNLEPSFPTTKRKGDTFQHQSEIWIPDCQTTAFTQYRKVIFCLCKTRWQEGAVKRTERDYNIVNMACSSPYKQMQCFFFPKRKEKYFNLVFAFSRQSSNIQTGFWVHYVQASAEQPHGLHLLALKGPWHHCAPLRIREFRETQTVQLKNRPGFLVVAVLNWWNSLETVGTPKAATLYRELYRLSNVSNISH